MKVALANRKNEIESHFGHSTSYLIYSITGNEIIDKETLQAEKNGGCKSNIFYDLRLLGVSVFLAGNIGKGAYNKFRLNGIEVLSGFSGDSDQAVMNFLQGKLPPYAEICEGHKNNCNH